MNVNDIKKTIEELASDINHELMNKQQAINKHWNLIESIKNNGIEYKAIYDILKTLTTKEITYEHFKKLIARARKRSPKCVEDQPNNISVERVISREILSNKNNTEKKLVDSAKDVDEKTLPDYMKVCFGSERIAKRAIEANVSIEEIRSWKCPNQINLGTRLTNYIQTK